MAAATEQLMRNPGLELEMWKTQGCFVEGWRDGVRLGAVREGGRATLFPSRGRSGSTAGGASTTPATVGS